jgi:hypothetical protein
MTTPTDKELRALALAATPGPWHQGEKQELAFVLDKHSDIMAQGYDTAGIDWCANTAFIAAANPQTVIGLLDRIDELKAALKPFGAAKLTSCSVLFGDVDKLKIQAVATFDTDYSQDVIDAFNKANALRRAKAGGTE